MDAWFYKNIPIDIAPLSSDKLNAYNSQRNLREQLVKPVDTLFFSLKNCSNPKY